MNFDATAYDSPDSNGFVAHFHRWENDPDQWDLSESIARFNESAPRAKNDRQACQQPPPASPPAPR